MLNHLEKDYKVITDLEQQSTSDSEHKPLSLRFPWGRLSIGEILPNRRARHYLRWVQEQPTFRRLVMVDRLLGLKPHRNKESYKEHKAWT
jgi:hypothetical protein